jgi:putative endonuclease
MPKQPAVYILASRVRGTLYIGVTSNLVKRVHQHRQRSGSAFTDNYGVKHLVYYELADDMTTAIVREKRLKKWCRVWKLRLIEEFNPHWDDLWSQISGGGEVGEIGFPPARE